MNQKNFKTNVLKHILFFILIFIFSMTTFTSSASTNNPPTVGTIDPSSGSSLPYQGKTFTTTYKDPDGFQDLSYCMLMINTEVNPLNCCYVRYTVDADGFSLMNDSGTTFLALDENNLIQNSYAILDCFQSAVTYPDANTIQVEWFITFKKAFSGKAYNTYLYAKDKSGLRTDWKKKGTWTVGYTDGPHNKSIISRIR
ncbi:hypothetical protein ES703_90169 [subsurface metagenome]